MKKRVKLLICICFWLFLNFIGWLGFIAEYGKEEVMDINMIIMSNFLAVFAFPPSLLKLLFPGSFIEILDAFPFSIIYWICLIYGIKQARSSNSIILWVGIALFLVISSWNFYVISVGMIGI